MTSTAALSARGCVSRITTRTSAHRASVAPVAATGDRRARHAVPNRISVGPLGGVGAGLPSAVPRGRSAGLARRKVTRAPEAAAAGISAPGTDGGDDAAPRKASGKSAAVLAVALGALAWAGYVLTQNTVVGQAAYQALAKTGFTAAFALIFVSELGDKTFFIAAILAMQHSRSVHTAALFALR